MQVEVEDQEIQDIQFLQEDKEEVLQVEQDKLQELQEQLILEVVEVQLADKRADQLQIHFQAEQAAQVSSS